MKTSLFNRKPETLREALDAVSSLLIDPVYGRDLWNVLTALRGPDSRSRRLKYATTCVIRKAAFPDEPTEGMSVFKTDSETYAARRIEMELLKLDTPHFREHIYDAFDSLGLETFKENR